MSVQCLFWMLTKCFSAVRSERPAGSEAETSPLFGRCEQLRGVCLNRPFVERTRRVRHCCRVRWCSYKPRGGSLICFPTHGKSSWFILLMRWMSQSSCALMLKAPCCDIYLENPKRKKKKKKKFASHIFSAPLLSPPILSLKNKNVYSSACQPLLRLKVKTLFNLDKNLMKP